MSEVGGASAPGKLMLGGEYAVLDGAPAIVAAVQTRLELRFDEAAPSSTPEVEACLDAAAAICGARPAGVEVDASELRRSDRKLGVGSSAAKAAAATAAVHALAGRDLGDPDVLQSILSLALEGHRAVSPEGSGADVAASVLGGTILYRKTATGFEARPLRWPSGLSLRVVWTGVEASTRDLIRQVRALGDRDPALLGRRLEALAAEAQLFADAFESGTAAEVVAAAGRYGECMAELGRASGAPIVEERLSRVAELARRAGGSAKPSGAGGGDIAVAFFARREDAEAFEALVIGEGMDLVDVALGGPGVLPLPT